jgi:hypothetical protein
LLYDKISALAGERGLSIYRLEKDAELFKGSISILLLKTDVVRQIVNDAAKAPSMAALFSVNQKVDNWHMEECWSRNGRVRYNKSTYWTY